MKVKNPLLIVLPLVLTLLLGAHYAARYEAVRLVEAIRAGDTAQAERIIRRTPASVNAYPSLMPRLVNTLCEVPVHPPLFEACRADSPEMVQLLVAHGADVNANNGWTALHVTLEKKQPNWYAIARCLLAGGATLDYTTRGQGDSVASLVDIVSRWGPAGDAEQVKAMFFYALNRVDHRRIDWPDVLGHAAASDRLEIVTFLLESGLCEADPAQEAFTPLMWAARDASPEMVALLLRHGADPTRVNDRGMTAYDLALQHNPDTAPLLAPETEKEESP